MQEMLVRMLSRVAVLEKTSPNSKELVELNETLAELRSKGVYAEVELAKVGIYK